MISYPVVIVGYDPVWAQMFEREQELILQMLSDIEVIVEHIGSTSVPGLAAKPIIDILAVVPDALAGEKNATTPRR